MSTVSLLTESAEKLMSAEIRVSPRFLEEVLEALAGAQFPINPNLEHQPRGRASVIRFPVAESQVGSLRDLLAATGFSSNALRISRPPGEGGSSYEATL